MYYKYNLYLISINTGQEFRGRAGRFLREICKNQVELN